ncbi:MAG: hypothetical protein HZB29_07480 [Nitrospinae bacterium]|nr:hypothetical protein [Nitrospinota bacterium]
MTLDDALQDIIQRLGSADGGGIISWSETQRWPNGALEIFLKAGLLKPTVPAQSVECPGCENNCFMPVHVYPSKDGRPTRAFVACDQRDDMGRIKITQAQLQQWQITSMQVARWVSDILGMEGKPERKKTKGAIRLGVLQGESHWSCLELDATKPVSLSASGYSLPLAYVVYCDGKKPTINRDAILGLVDREAPDEASNSYQTSTERREARKLNTEAMYERWRKAYRELKIKRPGMSDVWCSQQIAKMDIANGSSPDTIRKNMKPKPIRRAKRK